MDISGVWQPLAVGDNLDDLSDLYLQFEVKRLEAVIARDPLPAGDPDPTWDAVWLQLETRLLLLRVTLELDERERLEEERQAWLERGRADYYDRRDDEGGRAPELGFPSLEL